MDVLTTTEWILLAILIVQVLTMAALFYQILRTPASEDMAGGTEHPLLKRLANEPVRVRVAVLGLLAVAGSFGLPVSDVQQGVIVAAVLAVLAVFGESARHEVVPVNKLSATVLKRLDQ